MSSLNRTPSSTAPSLTVLGMRVFLTACLVVSIFTATWLTLSWKSTRQEQIDRIQGMADIIADGANKHFDLVLGAMSRFAVDVDRNQAVHAPGIASLMLRQFLADNRDAIAVALQDRAGHVVAALGDPHELQLALAQPHAAAHEHLAYGPPLACGTYHDCLPFRYDWRSDDANTHFTVLALYPIQKISQSWQHLSRERGLHIGLLRQDGIPLAWVVNGSERQVWAGGQIMAAADLQHFDRREFRWPDGVMRYTAVTVLHKYHVVSIIGADKQAIAGAWWQGVQLPVYLISGMTLAALIIYLVLSRRFSRRMEMIGQRLQDEAVLSSMPSSGVYEIDHLVAELNQSRTELQRVAENREKMLLSAAHAGTYAVNLDSGLLQSASSTFLAMLGYAGEPDKLLGRPWHDLYVNKPVSEKLSLPVQRVVMLRHADNHPRWIALAEYDAEEWGRHVRYGMAIDVSEREQLLETVHNQSERLHALWQLATDRGLSETERIDLMLRLGQTSLHADAAMIVEVAGQDAIVRFALDARQFAKPGDTLQLGVELREWVNDGNQAFSLPDCTLGTLGFNTLEQPNLRIFNMIGAPVRVGGEDFGVLLFWSYTSADDVPVAQEESDFAYVALLASWFGFVKLEQHQRAVLETQALTDGLTGLPNRRAAEIRFADEMSHIKRAQDIFSVAICDLDRFKLINDHYGHPVGDEVLKQVAGVMKASLREGDWLARWGGEEFIVFLRGSNAASATLAMERLRQAVKSTPIHTLDGDLDVTTSVGIGVFRGDDDNLARVLSEADGCLYEAKRAGRDCVVVHEVEARKSMLWHAGMLKRALQECNINPAFQVIVDLQTRKVVADEALARLRLPDGQVLAAGEFIEAAEAVHLIHSVDETIIKQAMMRCKARIGGGTMSQSLAHFVNVSPQFLQRPELVANLLHDAKLFCANCDLDVNSPKPLVFEITERQLVEDFDRMKQHLQPLIDFGFRFALDDFGSGYSSFLYLAQLPIAFLKIEGWMIQNMWDNPRIAAMLESIVLFAKHQGIITIAEFIEDERTAARLQEMGVDWGQGYYFGRPELD